MYSKTVTQTDTIRQRKSESLTKDELSALKKFRKGFQTEVECAISIGIDRNVLNRILFTGSGSPDSIGKIKAAIKPKGKKAIAA